MKKQLGVASVVLILVATLFTVSALASDAIMGFSSDKNGQNWVYNIQEGDQVFIVIKDSDQNIDCDIRDKMSPDLKIMDPKTGAYIVWNADPNLSSLDLPDGTHDYLEETGADTGVFVSARPFVVGTRESWTDPTKGTHMVDSTSLTDFQWGNYLYTDYSGAGSDAWADNRCWLRPGPFWEVNPPIVSGTGVNPSLYAQSAELEYIIGRFENMDTLIGVYQDPNQAQDVAVGMMKIDDDEATVQWDRTIYPDGNGAATLTIADADENLNSNQSEYVPVFILVNPGSWNPVQSDSPTNFCMLKSTGGVLQSDGTTINDPIRWYNIYNTAYNAPGSGITGNYFVQYPTQAMYDAQGDPNKGITWFDTLDPDGITPVLFYAQETTRDSGVFQLNLNSILSDLQFKSLRVGDVLVAYYLDPNDEDDFKLATAYIETNAQVSSTQFTDVDRNPKSVFALGQDSVYVQVVDGNANVDSCCPETVVVHVCDPHGEDDAEWLTLDEQGQNSPVFLTMAGIQLTSVWDALGIGLFGPQGGFQLQLDNWKIEAFNEDDIYARYNDSVYTTTAMAGLGDLSTKTAFPPEILKDRVANDVSFDTMSISDNQVFTGQHDADGRPSPDIYFLDRYGNRIETTGQYANSDCVFVEVVDSDQNEDSYRRERIDAYWDGGQNYPFGPQALNPFTCQFDDPYVHYVNPLLGDTNIFNNSPTDSMPGQYLDTRDDSTDTTSDPAGWAKLYVMNPRNGRWASVDLLETGAATGVFVSVTCIDLVDVYACVPTLDVAPGDTIVAFYQDPSNHSDSAMAQLKVGVGGGQGVTTPESTAKFVYEDGSEAPSYDVGDTVYVMVTDPSQAGATLLANAVEIDGVEYDLTPFGDTPDTFITDGLDLDLSDVDELTATYTDPADPTDSSIATVDINPSELDPESFYVGPNPFDTDVTFGFSSGVAKTMQVVVYDLSGKMVWDSTPLVDRSSITWDGAGLANGAYIYVVTGTDGTDAAFDPIKGKVFINR